MARGRMLNKSISGSIKFHNLSDDTCRLLATWLIAHLDMRGVFYGDAAMVRSVVFPRRADVCIERVEGYLQEMEQHGLMWRFVAKGDVWQVWPGFDGEQIGLRADRESTPFPEPPDTPPDVPEPESGNVPEVIRQSSGNHPPQSKVKEVKGIEENLSSASADYHAIRQAWSELFPDKPQPRADNKTLQGKVKTRMGSPHFVDNWRTAMQRAARSTFCNGGSWFDFGWFVKNDANYEACLSGKYDDKGGNGNRHKPPPTKDPFTWDGSGPVQI